MGLSFHYGIVGLKRVGFLSGGNHLPEMPLFGKVASENGDSISIKGEVTVYQSLLLSWDKGKADTDNEGLSIVSF